MFAIEKHRKKKKILRLLVVAIPQVIWLSDQSSSSTVHDHQ
jgi:hypothetical protein